MAATISFGRRLLIAMMALVLSLAILALRPVPAYAQTIVSVIDLPAVVIDNQCNGEPVALSGDLLTVVTTRPTPHGGTTVRSVSATRGLQGTSLVSDVSYLAVELSGTIVNQLPPPGTGTFFSTFVTLLLPQGQLRAGRAAFGGVQGHACSGRDRQQPGGQHLPDLPPARTGRAA